MHPSSHKYLQYKCPQYIRALSTLQPIGDYNHFVSAISLFFCPSSIFCLPKSLDCLCALLFPHDTLYVTGSSFIVVLVSSNNFPQARNDGDENAATETSCLLYIAYPALATLPAATTAPERANCSLTSLASWVLTWRPACWGYSCLSFFGRHLWHTDRFL